MRQKGSLGIYTRHVVRPTPPSSFTTTPVSLCQPRACPCPTYASAERGGGLGARAPPLPSLSALAARLCGRALRRASTVLRTRAAGGLAPPVSSDRRHRSPRASRTRLAGSRSKTPAWMRIGTSGSPSRLASFSATERSDGGTMPLVRWHLQVDYVRECREVEAAGAHLGRDDKSQPAFDKAADDSYTLLPLLRAAKGGGVDAMTRPQQLGHDSRTVRRIDKDERRDGRLNTREARELLYLLMPWHDTDSMRDGRREQTARGHAAAAAFVGLPHVRTLQPHEQWPLHELNRCAADCRPVGRR
eukprot:scaffold74986_cov26-Tisochrysis_lutea.AAC.3